MPAAYIFFINTSTGKWEGKVLMTEKGYVEKIIYRYEDASVQPEFQRNFTVSLAEDEIVVIVDG